MTPKLLQKKSNRFLQLALPENLIANKRIGKREKYNHRPGAAANNLRGMEKRILGQWAFSWNMYKKRMEKQRTGIRIESPIQESRPEKVEKIIQPPALLRARFTSLPPGAGSHSLPFHPRRGTGTEGIRRTAFPCFLVAPSLYILQDRISRALGGNVIQYLKESNAAIPLGKGTEGIPKAKAAKLRFHGKGNTGETRLEYPVYDFDHSFSGKKGGPFLETLSPNLISDAPVHFGHKRGEMLIEHCRKNKFNMIYSLLAAQILQNKARGDRRDRIADHYRNQLAEWRKMSFLYGGLGLKAALRLHRQAHLLEGDVDSNFLSLLECRLDVTLKRAFFFSTLKAARQWIQRGKIYVNNQPCTFAGAVLQPADLITISPSATMEWRKSRLQTFSLMAKKGAIQFPGPPVNWRANKNKISMQTRLPKVDDGLHRRFPFSPALMRKWKEWSQIWSNSRYSFSERHNWRTNLIGEQNFINAHFAFAQDTGISLNDRFTGKGSQRFGSAQGIGRVSSTQPFYSSSCLTNYLSVTNSQLKNGQSLAISDPQINLKENIGRQTSPRVPHFAFGGGIPLGDGIALDFSLLQRRQTCITSFLCGLPMAVAAPKAKQRLNQPSGLHQVRPGKLAGQGARRDRSQHQTTGAEHVLSTPVRFRLGQSFGGQRKKRCQWLHQLKSNVVDGLHALRWNRGFARKKSQGEKRNQWRWSCIKPLHLECSYKLGTVIFLFFPQKLAWPSSINVSLIRKKLRG